MTTNDELAIKIKVTQELYDAAQADFSCLENEFLRVQDAMQDAYKRCERLGYLLRDLEKHQRRVHQ